MRKIYYPIILIFVFVIAPFAVSGNATTNTSDLKVSMANTFNKWQDLNPTIEKNYSLESSNTYWSNNALKLVGTHQLLLNLTTNNMEYTVTGNSFFHFAWQFQSNQYDYIGFILRTPTNSLYIVSYYGHTVFANGSTSAIYEFTNEQPNTWYEHDVNISALYLQAFGSLPQKITGIEVVNAYFGSTGSLPSNQVSYFDNFQFETKPVVKPLQRPNEVRISMNATKNNWQETPTGMANFTTSTTTTYWSSTSLKLEGTENVAYNLTANNQEYAVTNSSFVHFAWQFQSTAYDYVGIILTSSTNSLFIVSDFGQTVFANGTTQGIYEFTNEQTNTWYKHDVNITALYLQIFGSLPQKITGIRLLNTYFAPSLSASNQVSYFDDVKLDSNPYTTTPNLNNIYVSMNATKNNWKETPTGTANYTTSTSTTLWSNTSLQLTGTERLDYNLTTHNMNYYLTNNSIFKFAWQFQSNAYDYVGYILYTPSTTLYIVSYFGHTIFGNGSVQGIYEFNNEQPNTWYAHEVNLTSLYLQIYGFVPTEITSIAVSNAYFGATGLIASNQVSYFDNAEFITNSSSLTPTTSTTFQTFSMANLINAWQDLNPSTVTIPNNALSTNSITGTESMNLNTTDRLLLNLTEYNMEYNLSDSSFFNFSWQFQSNAYDYVGFILYTPTTTLYIVSYFGHTIFGNGTVQGIYEFNNEQPNTWYTHEVNLTALYLQIYGYVPQKITSIMLVNAYFGSTGLIASNQVSYFSDFALYTKTLPPLKKAVSVISSALTNSSLISSISSQISSTPVPFWYMFLGLPALYILRKRKQH